MIPENIIYLDIECATPTGKANAEKDIPRYIGLRYKNGFKNIIPYSHEGMKQLNNILKNFQFVVGHNILEYDIPVLRRYGLKYYGKYFDTYQIIDKRAKAMMYLDLEQSEKSLKSLARRFGLNHQKGDFDYRLLNKPSLNSQEWLLMKKYLEADLDTGYDLFIYLYDFFSGFKEFLPQKDITSGAWLTASAGSVAYKVVCFKAGLPEIYDDNAVSAPFRAAISWVNKDIKTRVDNVRVFDFNSLYPQMMIGGNLYSQAKENEEYWHGSGIFKSIEEDPEHGIRGKYSKITGKVETAIKELYELRVSVKKQMKGLDKSSLEWIRLYKLQLAIKIIINTIYGILGNAKLASVYNSVTAGDVTAMARRCITFAKETFESYGYRVIYQHTDSLYVEDPYNDKDTMLKIARFITDEQIKSFNIDNKNHNFEHQEDIEHFWLIQTDDGSNIKNRNVRIVNGEVEYTGIKIKNNSLSKVSKILFKDYMTPELKKAKDTIFFPREQLVSWIKEIAYKNPEYLNKRYRVNDPDKYSSKTSIQFQIASKYGYGEHFLITNKFVGVGKNKKYTTIKELQDVLGEQWINSIDMSEYLADVSEFIDPKERGNNEKNNKRKTKEDKDKSQTSLVSF